MTTTMSAPVPQEQRLRLMRSTRKLGAILGTTPLIDCSDYSAGRLALKLASPSSTQPLPRPLVLRLQSVPSAPSRASTVGPAPHSPISPTFATFTSSTFDSTLAIDTRRKKMAKLTRTLGENIPPELVFPSTTKKQRHRSSSVGSLAQLVLFPQDDEKELLISKEKDEQGQEVKPLPATPVPTPTPTVLKKPHSHLTSTSSVQRSSSLQSTSSSTTRTRSKTLSRVSPFHTHSHSLSTTAPAPIPSIGAFPVPPFPREIKTKEGGYDPQTGYHLVRTDSFDFTSSEVESDRESRKSRESERRGAGAAAREGRAGTKEGKAKEGRAYGRRKEKEWSGEWNKKDMAIVMNQLRGLKA